MGWGRWGWCEGEERGGVRREGREGKGRNAPPAITADSVLRQGICNTAFMSACPISRPEECMYEVNAPTAITAKQCSGRA